MSATQPYHFKLEATAKQVWIPYPNGPAYQILSPDSRGVTLSPNGQLAYVADRYIGLQVFDVRDPARPISRGFTLTEEDYSGGFVQDESWGVTLSSDGRHAYLASESGLHVIDAITMQRIGHFETSGIAYDVTLSADERFAYISDGSSGLQIIDVSSPSSPTRVGTYNTAGSARGVNLSPDGQFAFVADGSYGIQAIDVLAGTFSATSDQVAASNLIISSSEVEEGAAGSVVGIINQVNESVGQSVIYSLTQGGGDTNNSSFVIVGNELRMAESLNHEAKDLYAVRLKAEESNGDSYELPLIIKVTDVNETPFGLLLSTNLIEENVAAGTLVGAFSTNDQDANDSFEYTFASGVGDTDNNAFQIVGNELLTKDAIDFETKEQYSVRIRTTDAGGLFIEKAFTLSVVDVNDRPSLVVTPSITMKDAAVASSLPTATSGVLVADVIDAGGTLNTFSDQDGDSAGIAITDTQLDGGTLWFSTDGGVTWTDVGDVAEHSARVLVADGTTKLYFQTSTDSAPALEEVFTFKAWDLTGGWNNGDSKVNTSQVTALTSDSTSGVYDGPAFDSPHYASDIKMSPDGRLAYVLDPTLGVHIFDVSTPNEIIRLTDYLASGDVNDITFSSDSNYAFIAMGVGGVQIVDISTPSSPVLKTTIATAGDAAAVELTPDDKKLYVAVGSAGIEVYDLSSVESPALASTMSIGQEAVNIYLHSRSYRVRGFWSPEGVSSYRREDFLFIANGNGGVTIVDAQSMTVLQEIDLDGFAYDLTMSADGDLLVAGGDAGLHVVDISWESQHPSNIPVPEDVSPRELPRGAFVSTVELPGRAYSVEASDDGRYAIVSGNETGVHAVDVSKPESPSVSWSWNTPGQAYGTAVSADGRFLFVADGDEGIRSQEINFLDDVRSLATESAATQTGFSADGTRAYSIASSNLYVNELGSDGEWKTVHRTELVNLCVLQHHIFVSSEFHLPFRF